HRAFTFPEVAAGASYVSSVIGGEDRRNPRYIIQQPPVPLSTSFFRWRSPNLWAFLGGRP
ncbi:MAG TPA: hypothetical protein VIG25_03845, partial [Pyrinomonadaceae bacterium]